MGEYCIRVLYGCLRDGLQGFQQVIRRQERGLVALKQKSGAVILSVPFANGTVVLNGSCILCTPRIEESMVKKFPCSIPDDEFRGYALGLYCKGTVVLTSSCILCACRIEESMVKEFPFSIPDEFKGMPWLKGRATMEMVINPINNANVKEITLQIVADGYNAPITAGNFVDLVQRGFYNGMEIQRGTLLSGHSV